MNFFSLTGNLAIIFNIPQSHDGTKVLQLLQFWTVQEGNRVSRDDKAWIRHCYTFVKIDASVRQKLIARRGFNPLYRESNSLMSTSWRFIYDIIIFFSFISFSVILGDFLVINTSVFFTFHRYCLLFFLDIACSKGIHILMCLPIWILPYFTRLFYYLLLLLSPYASYLSVPHYRHPHSWPQNALSLLVFSIFTLFFPLFSTTSGNPSFSFICLLF